MYSLLSSLWLRQADDAIMCFSPLLLLLLLLGGLELVLKNYSAAAAAAGKSEKSKWAS